ncbi:IS5 family transposase [Paraburkholderia sp. MM5477-R1]
MTRECHVRFCDSLGAKFPEATHHFGAKLHIGGDSQSGLAHSAVVTPANVHDKHPLPKLLHGQEQRVYGDSAYASQKALIRDKAPNARDFTNERTRRAGEVDEVAR